MKNTRQSTSFTPHALAFAVASALSTSHSAFAQEENRVAEEVVIIGSFRPGGQARLDQSTTTSVITPEDIQRQAPRNTAEIFRSIPGIRAEASGGDGNANLSIRGLPAPDGGARYLQIQEDGLPVVLFGDMQFGTADTFMRADTTIARVESIRGGSSSTVTSNGPGGTVNFISKTGEEDGGSVGLSLGLDYDEFRTDYEFGGQITDTVRFHMGGFHRKGEGPREVGYTANNGGQFKLNVTKDFDSGFARVYYKKLDDKAIAYLPGPLNSDGDGIASGFESDDLTQSQYLVSNSYINGAGDLKSSDVRDGQHPIVESLGFEIETDLGDGWTVNAKHRDTDITGTWTGTYFAGLIDEPTINFAGGASLSGTGFQYVNGPNQGEAYGGPVQDVKVYDVTWNDMGNSMTDVRFSKSFDSDMSLTLGVFSSSQSFEQEWHWSSYLTEAKGDNEALIDIVDGAGNALTDGGLAHYGSNWGGCCNKIDDLEFDVIAPYAALDFQVGNISVDLSIRYDQGTATGVSFAGVSGVDVGDINNDGRVSAVEQNALVPDINNGTIIDWDYGEFSYSAGLNYAFRDDMSGFGRISRGIRANADRKVGSVDAAGDLEDAEAVDIVDQAELGYKYQGDMLDLYSTFFYAETSLSSFDFTQTPSQLDKDYEIFGLELEFSLDLGPLGVSGSATWTDAEIVNDANDASINGNVPRRQADFIYNVEVSRQNDFLSMGLMLVGTTDSYQDDANTIKHDGFQTVGLFAIYDINEQFSIEGAVNNLFDTFGVTEQGGGGYRVINGRTSSITTRFRF